MNQWNIEETDAYQRCCKEYIKKHPNELKAVLDNFDTYFEVLNRLDNPLLVKAGFIHDEPMGIIAIDQKGGGKTVRKGKKIKLRQTRFYIFPDITTKAVHLICIGDKNSQRRRDIKLCTDYVKKLKG